MEYKKNWNTIVVGGGQAGLAAGYWLKKRNDDFIILDAAAHVGDAWRKQVGLPPAVYTQLGKCNAR